MSKVRKALKFSIVATYIAKIINLITVVVIARILTPEELGVYAIAAAMVMVVDVLKSFGVSSYIIKKDEIVKDDIRSALGLNVLITSSLGLLIIVMAKPLEIYYEYNHIAELLWLLSISFFVSPFFGNGMALLARNFEFKSRVKVSLTSQVFELIITITFISMGFSYFSIAIGVALKSLLQIVLIRLYQTKDMCWRPQFHGMSRIAKFGLFVTLSNLFERLTLISTDLIIGKLGTPSMVAYFSRGLGFIEFLTGTITQGISPVTMPFLAEKKRLGQALEPAYYHASKLLGAILLPVLLVAGVASYPVIILFFGEQWVESASLVSTLCLWGVFRNIHALSPSLLVTTGHERHLFTRNLVLFILTGFGVYLSFPFGLQGIAAAITTVAFIGFVYTTLLLKFVLDFSLSKFVISQVPNIIICTACYSSAYLSSQLIDFEKAPILLSFSVLIPLVTLAWLLTLWLTKHTLLHELKRMFGIVHT
ncbi:oligosaccharide flippase family protein [Paraglaciecola arctica]|uniref:oligosaccharide flippase family protein n=1 Tax=Paraglaciecola arctica TaxID=1128911 RepID=UPI001C06BC5A|nr:oligosaccharide flippase family protein [Paraglaciecola arctica]MBU3005716.1 oligosaccharide flippase family protein [Paraglaciecola arctica]